MSTLFKFSTYNYTDNIVVDSYDVNSVEISETYEDCNGVKHFIHIRDKIKGKFDLGFANLSDYETLLSRLASTKNGSTNSWTSVIVTPNNTRTQTTIDARIDFTPVLDATISRTEIVRKMTVTIEER